MPQNGSRPKFPCFEKIRIDPTFQSDQKALKGGSERGQTNDEAADPPLRWPPSAPRQIYAPKSPLETAARNCRPVAARSYQGRLRRQQGQVALPMALSP